MKYSKVILDTVRKVGGPDKIHIGHELIGAQQSASQTYKARLFKEKREKERIEAEKKRAEAAQEKKRKYEEEKDHWEYKVKKLKLEINAARKTISKHEADQLQAIENAEKFKNQSQKAASFKMAKVASKNISDLRAELDSKQDLLAKVMSKKPKSQ